MHALCYGARYGLLLLVDSMLFRWHGHRPVSWVRQFVAHRFDAPTLHCSSVPSQQDMQALRAAQAQYPERTAYLALGSEFSPWVGTRFFHEVKVVVGDRHGALPSTPGDGYGISLARFASLKKSLKKEK